MNKIQKFYIENNLQKAPKQLASDLKMDLRLVTNYVNKLRNRMKNIEVIPETKPDPTNRLHSMMTKDGITIMTEAASQLCDELRKDNKTGPNRYSKNITTAKKNVAN